MTKRSRLLAVALLPLLQAPSPLRAQAPPLRLGIEEAVERAVRANEDVLIARAEEARAAGIVREVRAGSLPEIDATFDYTRNLQTPVLFFNADGEVQQIRIGNDNEYTFGLSVSQTLFDFSLGPARRAASLSRDAGAALVEAARTSVALSVRTAYYDALLARSLLGVQEQALAQARRRLEQVESFYEAGTAAEFDVLTARVEVENLRPSVIEARNRLALDRNRLKRAMGLPLERPVTLTDSFPAPRAPEPLDAYLARARRERRDLRGQEIRVRLQEENLTAQRREALPSLQLTANLLRRASGDDLLPGERDFVQSASAGLSFSVPLFDGNARSGAIQQAEAELERERYRLARLREDIRLEVQQAHQAIQAARERVDASESNVRRAERALEIAQTRFRNGLSTQLELNDAELAVTEARTNFARAVHAYAVSRASLAAAVGER